MKEKKERKDFGQTFHLETSYRKDQDLTSEMWKFWEFQGSGVASSAYVVPLVGPKVESLTEVFPFLFFLHLSLEWQRNKGFMFFSHPGTLEFPELPHLGRKILIFPIACLQRVHGCSRECPTQSGKSDRSLSFPFFPSSITWMTKE
jgi:hypothetical protein